MFKLAHISDVHLGPLPEFRRRALLSKRITGYANWRLNRKGKLHDGALERLMEHLHAARPDHIALTGDLVNLALPEEVEAAKIWLGEQGSGDFISFVPGNHDTYVPGALKSICAQWHAYMSDDDSVAVRFPYCRIRQNVALIGANSGRATAPFMATGTFGQRQAIDTGEILKSTKRNGQFRVVMIHHPPFPNATVWSKRLIGGARFRKMIAEHGAELVLHGHTHIDSFEHIDGPNGPVPVIGVPSASQSPASNMANGRNRPGARYNLFEIDGQADAWHCHMREFGFENGAKNVTLIRERDVTIHS